jgi:hypothetical protein
MIGMAKRPSIPELRRRSSSQAVQPMVPQEQKETDLQSKQMASLLKFRISEAVPCSSINIKDAASRHLNQSRRIGLT